MDTAKEIETTTRKDGRLALVNDPSDLAGRVLADGRWRGPHGIGRFAGEMLDRLPAVRLVPPSLPILHPLEPVWLSLILARQKPAVYFSPGFNPPLRTSIPFVFTIFDLVHLKQAEESSPAKRAYYRMVVRPGARRAAAVLTASEYWKGEIVQWSSTPTTNVRVIPLGVSGRFSPAGRRHEPGYPYILYVGNRRPHKNVPRLLEAFSTSSLVSGMKLVLTGPPDSATWSVARSLRIEDSLIFAGPIEEQDLPALYRGATCLALPSLIEGFGLPAVEAMAAGVPVVAATATSLPEVVGDAAVLVDPTDVASIRHGLELAVQDEDLRRQLREKGLVRVRAFTWDETWRHVRPILAAAGER